MVLRTRLRIDLAEPAAERWTDDDLDRHIEHAVRDINRVAPREMVATELTIPDPATRELDISTLTDRIAVVAVQYPVDGQPRRMRHFEVWGDTLTLLTDTMPVAGAAVWVYYTAAHTVSDEESTLPAHLEDVALVGAAGYAALEYAAYAMNRVTVGDGRTPEQFLALGRDRLMQFRQDLTALKRERLRAIRTGELWTEDAR
jgi:hypothetical protein